MRQETESLRICTGQLLAHGSSRIDIVTDFALFGVLGGAFGCQFMLFIIIIIIIVIVIIIITTTIIIITITINLPPSPPHPPARNSTVEFYG